MKLNLLPGKTTFGNRKVRNITLVVGLFKFITGTNFSLFGLAAAGTCIAYLARNQAAGAGQKDFEHICSQALITGFHALKTTGIPSVGLAICAGVLNKFDDKIRQYYTYPRENFFPFTSTPEEKYQRRYRSSSFNY